jgi:MinD superfamily P-loop ATPase
MNKEKISVVSIVVNVVLAFSKTKYGFLIASAQLMPRFSGSGKVVYEVRQKAKEISPNSEIMLIDASAGIGCPVIASVTGTNTFGLLRFKAGTKRC